MMKTNTDYAPRPYTVKEAQQKQREQNRPEWVRDHRPIKESNPPQETETSNKS